MEITKVLGGGTSWYYLIDNGKFIDSSHEDDKTGMERLYEKREKSNKTN